MYGILLESIQYFIKDRYGEDVWLRILDTASIRNLVFSTHKTYEDKIMVRLAESCSKVLDNMTINDAMYYFGQCFVDFCRHYGYDKILRVAGRHYRDFLHGIDNLHETVRFSYPKLQSPSFIVDSEDYDGCVLTYRSKRVGFTYYVMGQLKQCALRFYNVNVMITILQEVRTEHGCHVKYRLDFDNVGFCPKTPLFSGSSNMQYIPVSSSTFFKLFPFCLVFDQDMVLKYTGPNLDLILQGRDIIDQRITDVFILRRPLVDFTWENILCMKSVIFELENLQRIQQLVRVNGTSVPLIENVNQAMEERSTRRLLLRGQMKYLSEWKAMAFLCTPLICNLEDLEQCGLYMNDLNMFDNSRDMVLAGSQHASKLEYLVEQQMETSKKIGENLQQLDQWRQKSNDLLYSMIPKSIAVRLIRGEDPINTCEVFEQVTIMFSYLIGFSEFCERASAMQIVECINHVFEVFDAIVDRYRAFKVETLGDAVYMVAAGVPDRTLDHANRLAGLALEFVEKSQFLKDPISENRLRVKIGMHSGSVVAGIVGRRTPQYCLFGDTVNTASRMQSYSEPCRIHISQSCHESIKGSNFVSVFRGRINVKGKGEQKTYWLAGRHGDATTLRMCQLIKSEHFRRKNTPRLGSFDSQFDLHSLHRSASTTSFSSSFDVSDDDSDLDNEAMAVLNAELEAWDLECENINPSDQILEDLCFIDKDVVPSNCSCGDSNCQRPGSGGRRSGLCTLPEDGEVFYATKNS
ncbi:soluble guanylate cyclase 88E-like [Gigantopelta aegis]|uniref:soluble guanylate cyclase 88E-like n=1 Tax=Gigantopelta aegis TaxID=1735272 RepID=UPI001B88B173|nr:soluble guanylate cyclase 88E-like [Gigantopelta aegis]